MPVISFPPEFDIGYYKMAYPELNFWGDSAVKEHYRVFAEEQGHSTCIYDRSEYLQRILQDKVDKEHLHALEIGCGNNPFLTGETVKYFETMDSESLKKRGAELSWNISRTPEKIDFVSPTGDLSVVDETFDIVYSVHVVEHCPDLVKHFQDVSRILNKGGLYVLIVPDKRYCFDYYHSESTLSEVIDAFVAERKIPRLADVINIAYTRTHNDPVLHWLGEHGERYGYRNAQLEPDAKAEIMGEYFFDDGKGVNLDNCLHFVEKYVEALNEGEYISTHCWRFTPNSFRYIMNLLNALRFIDLSLYRCCHTVWGRLEFVAMLEKN